MNFIPRNDFVLVRIVQLKEVGGLAMPDIAIQGKCFVVVAVGPDVKDLEPGDRVLMIGSEGVHYYPLPSSKDLLVIKQDHVVLVYAENEGQDENRDGSR